jgi:hypothetical protein
LLRPGASQTKRLLRLRNSRAVSALQGTNRRRTLLRSPRTSDKVFAWPAPSQCGDIPMTSLWRWALCALRCCSPASPSQPTLPQVTDVPKEVRALRLDPFYKKYVSAAGFRPRLGEGLGRRPARSSLPHRAMLADRDDILRHSSRTGSSLSSWRDGDDNRRTGTAQHDAEGLLGPPSTRPRRARRPAARKISSTSPVIATGARTSSSMSSRTPSTISACALLIAPSTPGSARLTTRR